VQTTAFLQSSGARTALKGQWSSALFDKLWQRLEIEEDEAPLWYILNCIAGLEFDLLRQCRERCSDMEDVVKFVVPIEKQTRSHGPNRIVTDTKVKYQGYVFAKLRLCEDVYEAIQGLDLCRSWMGTVNRKGYRKLPPAPVALNELEIENFGLEELEEGIEFKDESDSSVVNEEGIILDTEEADEKEKAKEKLDKEQLKHFKGLRPDDMIKVTGNNKFKGEDGIVKRLKNRKILVRFFTYGSIYDEWLDPDDVRKMTSEEVLRGLSGPSGPITQRDFDGDTMAQDKWSRRTGPAGLRNALMNNVSGHRALRNRRSDRTQRGEQYKRDMFGRSDEERRREEKNWAWYHDQQRPQGRHQNDQIDYRAGSDRENAMSDVDGQWGRFSKRRDPSEERNLVPERKKPKRRHVDENDWSAFVSPSQKKRSFNDEDDFFDSLMSELKDGPAGERSSADRSSEDDFFSSLISELDGGLVAPKPSTRDTTSDDNDFFAALEAELGGTGSNFLQGGNDKTDDFFNNLRAEMEDAEVFADKPRSSSDNGDFPSGDDDDFLSRLEAQLMGEEKIQDAEMLESKRQQGNKSQKGTKLDRLDADELTKKTVPDLKEMLRERGMKVSGKKSELIERLLQ
jgi:transcription antitermination factor NusG